MSNEPTIGERVVYEEEELLVLKTISSMIGITVPTILRWRREGLYDFPEPDLYFGKNPRWLKETIVRWIDERVSNKQGY